MGAKGAQPAALSRHGFSAAQHHQHGQDDQPQRYHESQLTRGGAIFDQRACAHPLQQAPGDQPGSMVKIDKEQHGQDSQQQGGQGDGLAHR